MTTITESIVKGGVIRQIKPLTINSEKTIRLLKRSHKAGYLLMGAADVRSARI